MIPSILAIGTAVPETRLRQDDVRDLFARQPGLDRLTRRLVHAAFDAAAIESRYTVLPQLAGGVSGTLDVLGDDGVLRAPSTGARNDEYRRAAPGLFAAAAQNALASAELSPTSITHVITVSCTGMFAPGPDYRLVRDLGLPDTVQRYHLGFVGCAAALPALRMASHIAASDPTAVILVATAELCSLHLRSSSDPEQIVAASVFADGAAAAVVTASDAFDTRPRLEFDGFGTQLIPEGEDDMYWTIGDEGFEMTLTAQVPRLVGRHARTAMPELLGPEARIDAWAVHPGGRSVLDRVEDALGSGSGTLDASRRVLRDHGNMSSSTVLFVLKDLWTTGLSNGSRVGALAFGPGLTVEAARLIGRHVGAEDLPGGRRPEHRASSAPLDTAFAAETVAR